jgi:hypothetical protein
MRKLYTSLLLCIPIIAEAQTPANAPLNPEWVYLRDYTFERMEATREVHDAEDNGTIRLVAYVYRPVKNDRQEVILYSHGSTASGSRSPKEPGDAPPIAVLRFSSLAGTPWWRQCGVGAENHPVPMLRNAPSTPASAARPTKLLLATAPFVRHSRTRTQ